MSMFNQDNYNLSVMWGYFNVPIGGSTEFQRKWCWHAIATHTTSTQPLPIIPTNWTDATPQFGKSDVIECYADNWAAMSALIAVLTSFWGE